MRATLSAMVVAAGLIGLGAAAQAAPFSASMPAGASAASEILQVQMMSPMERRMMRRNMMRRQMMRRQMRRNMMRRSMRRM